MKSQIRGFRIEEQLLVSRPEHQQCLGEIGKIPSLSDIKADGPIIGWSPVGPKKKKDTQTNSLPPPPPYYSIQVSRIPATTSTQHHTHTHTPHQPLCLPSPATDLGEDEASAVMFNNI